MTHRNLFEKAHVLSIPARLGWALLLALVGLTSVSAVYAATTRTIDVDNVKDSTPGNGCTLREAIDLANAGSGAGTYANQCIVTEKGLGGPYTYVINVPSYTYTLTGASGEDDNASGDLDIEANVTIIGEGAIKTAVDGDGNDRVFHIDPGGDDGSFTVQIGDVTIRDGNAGSAGGGIAVAGDNDTLYLSHTIVYANASAHNGGGIYNAGTLNITTSDVYSNTSSATAAYGGGGIYSDGTLNVTDSDVYSNTLTGSIIYGGGIYNAGTLTITGGSLSGNEARNDGGGGLANGGTASLTGVTIADNIAPDLDGDDDGYGGGIDNWGVITVTSCTLSGNEADDSGGGIYNASGFGHAIATITGTVVYSNTVTDFLGRGGGVYNKEDTVIIASSVISGNVESGGNGSGGGVDNDDGTMTITDSSVSDNEASMYGGGISNCGTMTVTRSSLCGNDTGDTGGGVFNYGAATITVTNTTLSGNRADGGGGGIYHTGSTVSLSHVTITDNTADDRMSGVGNGGGIYTGVGGTVRLQHTIVAGNSDRSSAPSDIHPDISGNITGDAYNLIGDTTGGAGTAGTGSDIVTSAPGLGPLADNGGGTWTHALLGGSPAVDAVPAASCTLAIDQRGESRPMDGDLDHVADCDIGAYEFVPAYIYLPLVLCQYSQGV
jgi:hypothetical protein